MPRVEVLLASQERRVEIDLVSCCGYEAGKSAGSLYLLVDIGEDGPNPMALALALTANEEERWPHTFLAGQGPAQVLIAYPPGPHPVVGPLPAQAIVSRAGIEPGSGTYLATLPIEVLGPDDPLPVLQA